LFAVAVQVKLPVPSGNDCLHATLMFSLIVLRFGTSEEQ